MTNRIFRRAFHRGLLLAGGAAVLCAAPVAAQDAAETRATDTSEGNVIIVTATKRDTRIQDVPFSINALTQEDIQR